jgi:hypothetical protein
MRIGVGLTGLWAVRIKLKGFEDSIDFGVLQRGRV